MPSLQIRRVLVANQVIDNILAGSNFEFVGKDQPVAVYSTAAAADSAEATVQFGSEVIGADLNLGVEAVAGRGPLIPEDRIAADVAVAGDRLRVGLRDLGLGSTVITKVVIG